MAEKLTEVELSSIQMHETRPRVLAKDSLIHGIIQEDDIETAFGQVHVCVQGDRGRTPIFTYHDLGLNSTTCFQGFFNFEDMQVILRHFTVYHINAPGQHEGARTLAYRGMTTSESDTLLQAMMKNETEAAQRASSLTTLSNPEVLQGYTYPTMDQLAEMLNPVMQYYGLKTFIGFGVGAGANVLSRFALSHPEKVDGLVLINCTASRCGWTEWGYQKLNMWYLKSGQLSETTKEYLMWHWFGKKTLSENSDLVQAYTDYIQTLNPTNLGYFIESYTNRTDLEIVREFDPFLKKEVRNFKCPVMLVGGDASPHLNDVINMNARLDPENSTWMKFECGGMVHEEAPSKLCEAFRLFLQGMGYIPSLSKLSLARQASLGTASRGSAASVASSHKLPSAPVDYYHVQATC